MAGPGGQVVKKADGLCGQVVPANFLSRAADVLVGVGLGCLLQISRGHPEVKVSGRSRLPGTCVQHTFLFLFRSSGWDTFHA